MQYADSFNPMPKAVWVDETKGAISAYTLTLASFYSVGRFRIGAGVVMMFIRTKTYRILVASGTGIALAIMLLSRLLYHLGFEISLEASV